MSCYTNHIKNKNTDRIADRDPKQVFKFWEILIDFDIVDNNKENITYGVSRRSKEVYRGF